MITWKGLLASSSILWAAQQAMAIQGSTFVHLFEWKWDDIAVECEQVLGPKGFAAVQVSPPQKSIDGGAWWTRYQPLSYAIEGRSGNRDQFQSMVNRCKAAGVDIYVDAVINHMAAADRYFSDVPYYSEHFHNCQEDINYQDRWSIQNCDLVGLNDLKTEDAYVQGKIADYLNDLTSIGVAGFRIDAAKHIPASDIGGIISRLEGNPFIFQEVIQASGEPVQPDEYVGNGAVTEFRFEREIGSIFKGYKALAELQWINSKGWLNSEQAVVFVSNHDDQRQNTSSTLTYKDVGDLYYIGEIAMLAYPYGYPKVMSSYYFNDHDQGPPSSGANTGDQCFTGGWVCEHRWNGIANMVEFRKQTASSWYLSNWWDNGANQIAFGRGSSGFVVINRDDNQVINRNFSTGMAEGSYCDIIHGNYNKTLGTCDGPVISVDSEGMATISVDTIDAVAFHVGTMVDPTEPPPPPHEDDSYELTFICNNGETFWGQSVFVVGSIPEIGSWNVSQAVKLDPSNYPQWTGTVTISTQGSFAWKCIKGLDDDPSSGTEWQGGDDNIYSPGDGSSATASF